MDQMRDQRKLDAKAAIEDDIFLLSFAKKKNIQVTDEDLQKDIEAIKIANKKYIDEKPDDAKALFDNPRWRSYIKSVILKRMAYETFLRENGYYKVVGEPKPSSAEDAATVQLKEDNNATSTGKTDKKLIIPN
jgi:FKBP-type peptidyl-prolyl cis-trans isomerase (trigger factor)